MPGGLAASGHLEDRLVAVGVERLPERVDPADAVLLEGVEQRTFGRFDAGQQSPHRLVARGLVRHALDRTAQIVGRLEQIAGQARGGEPDRLLALALGTPAAVLLLGQRAQEPVVAVRHLRLELGHASPQVSLGGSRLVRISRRARRRLWSIWAHQRVSSSCARAEAGVHFAACSSGSRLSSRGAGSSRRPSGLVVTSTLSPSRMRPSRISSARGFCSSRWITRLSGRAP